jgi:hypothetical protein
MSVHKEMIPMNKTKPVFKCNQCGVGSSNDQNICCDECGKQDWKKLVTDGGISVGSYDDLTPSKPQPVDRNPKVGCEGENCDNELNWDEWQEIYSEITPETTLRCNECIGKLIEQARIERKKERNNTLDNWEA